MAAPPPASNAIGSVIGKECKRVDVELGVLGMLEFIGALVLSLFLMVMAFALIQGRRL
jgi:hypothetical protein